MCTLSYVHACTHSYTSWFMHVPWRIWGGTYMYPDVYEGVHIYMYPDVFEGVHVCTPSYSSGYIHASWCIGGVHAWIRTAGYTCVPTLSTYGEVDPFCSTYWYHKGIIKTKIWPYKKTSLQAMVYKYVICRCLNVFIVPLYRPCRLSLDTGLTGMCLIPFYVHVIKWNQAQNHYVYMLKSQYWYRLGYTFLYQMLFNFGSE